MRTIIYRPEAQIFDEKIVLALCDNMFGEYRKSIRVRVRKFIEPSVSGKVQKIIGSTRRVGTHDIF